MHAYFLVRGVNHQVEAWKALMQGQVFKWKRKDLKTGKEFDTFIQGALRPILLFEYVFPEESLDEVLLNTNTHDGIGKQFNAEKAFGMLLRTAIGAKKPKKIKKEDIPNIAQRLMSAPGVGVCCLGVKKDKRKKWEEVGYEQELL